MRFFWQESSEKMVLPYIESIEDKSKKLKGDQKKLFREIINKFENEKNDVHNYFRQLVKDGEISAISELFAGDRAPVLELLLGEEGADKYNAYLLRLPEFPYTTGYYRLSLRSTMPILHLDTALSVLASHLYFKAAGIPLGELMGGLHLTEVQRTFRNQISYSSLLTVEIDLGNAEIMQNVRDIICSDNQAGLLSYDLVKGVLRSKNTALHELLGNLLLAAKLQEGLRQVIVENMDETDTETFKYFFNLIMANNLQRFSAIKRAIGTWTGLFDENSVDRVTNKNLALIEQSLNEADFAERALTSEDNVVVYLGLWSIAFYRVEDAVLACEEIIAEGVEHKVLLVSYFLNALQNFSNRSSVAKIVFQRYAEDLRMIAAYSQHYLVGYDLYRVNCGQQQRLNEQNSGYSYYSRDSSDANWQEYFTDKEEAKVHYAILAGIIQRMEKKEVVYDPCIFPWYAVRLVKCQLAERLACLAYVIGEQSYLDDICQYYEVIDSWCRRNFLYGLLGEPQTEAQMQTLVKALVDRAEAPRKAAYNILKTLTINPVHYQQMEEMLKYKSGDLRQAVIKLLLKQENAALLSTIERLIGAKDAEKRLGGLDLILSLKQDDSRQAIYREAVALAGNITKPTAKEKILIDQITITQAETVCAYSAENGYGLYAADYQAVLPEAAEVPAKDGKAKAKKALDKLKGHHECTFFQMKPAEAYQVFKKLDQLIAANSQREYQDIYGETCLLGNHFTRVVRYDKNELELDAYPFPELWRDFYKQEIKSLAGLFELIMAIALGDNDGRAKNQEKMIVEIAGFDWGKHWKKAQELTYWTTARKIINSLFRAFGEGQENALKVRQMLKLLLAEAQDQGCYRVSAGKRKDYWGNESEICYYLTDYPFVTALFSYLSWQTDEEFADVFALRMAYAQAERRYDLEPEAYSVSHFLPLLYLGKACTKGIIAPDLIYQEIFARRQGEDTMQRLSNMFAGRDKSGEQDQADMYGQETIDCLRTLNEQATARILEIELKRGDLPTAVSKLVSKLAKVSGNAILVQILVALGSETPERSMYYWSADTTKKGVLSHLLRHCYPEESDSADTLKPLLQGTEITDRRLVETAMYAPQWLDIIQALLGWQGLRSACYYFHAHMNEGADDQKKAIIAKYTPIDLEDLQEGAFDINWFKDAYKTIGEERFALVYDAAKYITDGTKHSRARKFADAVNGKLDIAVTKKQIADKRNKDLLMAYCLIPLDKKNKKDLLERYQYLQQFLKEGKQFGAQRRASENKAVDIAMENLARNAGFEDVTRLTWRMETMLIKELAGYFTDQTIDGVVFCISIDEQGTPSIQCSKDGKELKKIPAKFNKEAYVAELKEVLKKLKNQHSRSRVMLERAMEDQVKFYAEELKALMANPIVWPLLQNLVFISNETLGYFTVDALQAVDGQMRKLTAKAEVRIAHPLDLYHAEVWAAFQQDLFEREIKQPFKQIFRELYLKTEEEKAQEHSLRYAGNQIQPRKTVAVLRTRRWVADYEEGLQKVYYRENIIAKIYALADWFSPADIEAPTLEWVVFSDRKTYKTLKIAEVPDILFSEVMRDVDLAVSVAHAGGVDPETSHSTIEMRKAIVNFTLPLFRLSNVTFTETHAIINGILGEYSIHLGSGVIHQKAGAAINVLPVHAQHRGKLFLPFVDEDPKTAEIISKILLFAEDQKIKDPFILEQIKAK